MDPVEDSPGQTSIEAPPTPAEPEAIGVPSEPAVETPPVETPSEPAPGPPAQLPVKVYGENLNFDTTNVEELTKVVQKGLAYDRREEGLQEQVDTRAREMLQEMANKETEEKRISELREADPLAAEFELYKTQRGSETDELNQKITDLGTNLQNIQWQTQVSAAQAKYPDLVQRDWDLSMARVVASNGTVTLDSAAAQVKLDNATNRDQIIKKYLEEAKNRAAETPPVPGPGGSAAPAPGEEPPVQLRDKNATSARVLEYLKAHSL